MAVKSRMCGGRANVLAYLNSSSKRNPIEDRVPLRRLLHDSEPVGLDFFVDSPETVGRELLGCVLLHGETAGMIVEAEAYLGQGDLAAHSSRGRTPRTEVIFGPPGRAYVYFIYGMHECFNVVVEPDGKAGCVLVRALDPICGLEEMYRRRQWNGPVIGLTNGPGKLTQALAITRSNTGDRLDRGRLAIRRWRERPRFTIAVSKRIGITQCADLPLRFTWAGHPSVSRR
jgi:DNA-3-methyladenine glycosylase